MSNSRRLRRSHRKPLEVAEPDPNRLAMAVALEKSNERLRRDHPVAYRRLQLGLRVWLVAVTLALVILAIVNW